MRQQKSEFRPSYQLRIIKIAMVILAGVRPCEAEGVQLIPYQA
jgi:hypothetical protein